MLKKQGVQDLMLNSGLDNVHEWVLALMMVPIEKQRVWNGLVISIIPVFALKKIARPLTLTIATALPEL